MMKLFWKKINKNHIFDFRKATFDETSSDYDKLLNDDMCTLLMDEEGNDDDKLKLQNKTIIDEVIDNFHWFDCVFHYFISFFHFTIFSKMPKK